MQLYDHTSPTLIEHIQVEHGEGKGGAESMDAPKNPEETGISFNGNNYNSINSRTLLEQDVNISSERKQNSPLRILRNIGSDINGAEASNSDSICLRKTIENEKVLDLCN